MEDCSTDEWLQQETLCHRQWTDEYVECPRDVDEAERNRRLLVDVVRHTWKDKANEQDDVSSQVEFLLVTFDIIQLFKYC